MDKYRALCVVRPALRWFVGTFSALLAATILFLFVHHIFNPPLLVILLLCAYIPVGAWYHRMYAIRRHYRRHPELYLECMVACDEWTISVSNANAASRLRWNLVSFLLETRRGLMFMLPQMRVLCWLPQRLFEGNDHKRTIIGYALANKIPVRTVDW